MKDRRRGIPWGCDEMDKIRYFGTCRLGIAVRAKLVWLPRPVNCPSAVDQAAARVGPARHIRVLFLQSLCKVRQDSL